MRAIKLLYWDLLEELGIWRAHALNAIPGKLGRAARRRYYATRLQSCGSSFTIEENARIQSPQNVRVGDNVTIGRDCYLSTSGGLEIGSDCSIGAGTKIWTNNHVYQDPGAPFVDQGYSYRPVRIERDVWIGARCFIKPGTIIKAGAVIRPGTVLAKAVPPHAVVEGNPGQIVGWRTNSPDHQDSEPSPPPSGGGGKRPE